MWITLPLALAAIALAVVLLGGRRTPLPATPIAEARPSDKLVLLHGRALIDPPTLARISGTRSVYWEAELWDTRYQRNRLPAIKARSQSRVIWIEDGTGRIPVLLHGVEWKFPGESRIPPGEHAPSGAREFAAAHGYDWDSGRFRAVERCLAEGTQLYVCGTVWRASEIAAALERSQRSPVASLVAALEKMREGGSARPVDLAAFVRQHFSGDERIVWCADQPMIVGVLQSGDLR